MISTGNKNNSAVDLAKEVLQLGKNNLREMGKLCVHDIMNIIDNGKAKEITL